MGVVLFFAIVLAIKISIASKQIAEHQAQPRLVLHYPAQGPSPVAMLAVTGQTVILDRKLAGLVLRRNEGAKLDDAELTLLAGLDALGEVQLRIGDTLREGWSGAPIQGLPLSVRVKSKEYAGLVAELEARAVADPHVVAEALLAAASSGQVPTLCTVDLALRHQLNGTAVDPQQQENVDLGMVSFSGHRLRLRQLR